MAWHSLQENEAIAIFRKFFFKNCAPSFLKITFLFATSALLALR